MRTFLKFERSLVGEETNQAMRLKIWNSVIFFNFVWAKRLWNNLPGGHWRQEQVSDVHWVDCNDIEVEGTWVPNGFYMMPGGKHVKVLVVNHPSVGYSWDYWYKVIQKFLR